MLPIIKVITVYITKNIVTFSIIKTIGVKTIYRKIIRFNRKILGNRYIETKINNIFKFYIRLPSRIYNMFKK